MADLDATSSAKRPPSPLKIPVFRSVWIASLLSNFGGLIQSVGASWLMTSLTTSPTPVALVQASVSLPIMLFSLLAGAIADNLDRRATMLVAQCFMLIVSVILAIVAWLGLLTPWTLLGFTFAIGVGTALNNPAWQASVGDIVPRDSLPAAVAFNSLGFNIARSLGPAIGGAIVAAAGAAAAFLANALSYLVLIFVLVRRYPKASPRPLPPENLVTAMEAGIRYVSMSPHIRTVLLRSILFGAAASAVPALMPLVARDHIVGGPFTYGVMLGAFGMGAVGGALSSGSLRRQWSNEAIVRLSSLGFALGAAVTGVSGHLPIICIALFLAGAGWVLALSTFTVVVQMAAPRWVVGRALALYQMAAFGGMAGGSWLAGELADTQGIAFALFAASGFLAFVAIVAGRCFPLPEVAKLNLDPLRSWAEPKIAVDIEPRSGPIVITLDYLIDPSNIRTFLTEMSERRRIRIRDGARHWALMRDLEQAERWVERYHVATWMDYVRHNQRRTHEDSDNWKRILALHLGPGAPAVHRMIERQTGAFA